MVGKAAESDRKDAVGVIHEAMNGNAAIAQKSMQRSMDLQKDIGESMAVIDCWNMFGALTHTIDKLTQGKEEVSVDELNSAIDSLRTRLRPASNINELRILLRAEYTSRK